MSAQTVTINGKPYVVDSWSQGGVTLADPANPTMGQPTVILKLQATEIEPFVLAMRQASVS